MSSCTIIQDYDSFTFAADTAFSLIINDKIYRKKNVEVKKIYEVGRDVIFISGVDDVVDDVKLQLNNFLNKHRFVNVTELQRYLRMKYPDESNPFNHIGVQQIAVQILRIKNCESTLIILKQPEHYKIHELKSRRGESSLCVVGYDSKSIYKAGQSVLSASTNIYHESNFIEIYQKCYSTGVGESILLYNFNEHGLQLIGKHKLKEKGIQYADDYYNIENYKINDLLIGTHIEGTEFHAGVIKGSRMESKQGAYETTIENGFINTNYINLQQGNNYITVTPVGLTAYSPTKGSAFIDGGQISCRNLLGYASDAQNLKNNEYSNKYMRITANDNVVGTSSDMYMGSSGSPWAGLYATNGSIITSDERKKTNIAELDEKFLRFAKMIVPYTYQMLDGSSGRFHTGFIAQRIEQAMVECGISDMEFAGLIKSPIHARRLEGGEYDTTSEILDYDYALRYEEFIPLIFLLLNQQ